MDLIAAEHKQSSFLEKNPSGVIPVLELDDGTFISEAAAITEYLDTLDGNPILTGVTPRERAVIHMMQRRAEAFVLDPVGLYFHHATPGLGQALQAFKSPEWSARVEMGKREGDKARTGMKYFDTLLGGQAHVAGDTFSVADITLYAGFMFGDVAGLTVPADHLALLDWRARVSELPFVKNRSGQDFLLEDLKRLGF